ncbi:hypothetical protein [Clostridium weizhouense]|uniref:DUF1540 domain-containing protein n=1 Tax=Clostridium weizhouense TaxID=2859781 RepID=A0ABS7AK26_9CLOT|nr:hypothetical protein [Clostridium weizhouense]MBW6409013.1 hypothetical protein [Clostridium weizhouense]
MKCLNQACPFNKECQCSNDIVISGKAPCYGKDLVKAKQGRINMSSTNYLFRT